MWGEGAHLNQLSRGLRLVVSAGHVQCHRLPRRLRLVARRHRLLARREALVYLRVQVQGALRPRRPEYRQRPEVAVLPALARLHRPDDGAGACVLLCLLACHLCLTPNDCMVVCCLASMGTRTNLTRTFSSQWPSTCTPAASVRHQYSSRPLLPLTLSILLERSLSPTRSSAGSFLLRGYLRSSLRYRDLVVQLPARVHGGWRGREDGPFLGLRAYAKSRVH